MRKPDYFLFIWGFADHFKGPFITWPNKTEPAHEVMVLIAIKTHREKTCLWGFRPGPTPTGLLQ